MQRQDHVLVVDDDAEIRDLVARFLRKHEMRVDTAADGRAMTKLLEHAQIDLVVLDLMLPRLNGFEVCRTIRKHDRSIPILILSAKEQEVDKLMGFDLGADDYVTKPFSTRELVARVKAALRRAAPGGGEDAVFEYRHVHVDFPGQRLLVHGEPVEVSNREFRLLRFLIENRGRVLSRDQILNQVWGYDYEGTARTIDNFINNLRYKIERDPTRPVYILTARGVGYKFHD